MNAIINGDAQLLLPLLCREAKSTFNDDPELFDRLITADRATHGEIGEFDVRRGETDEAIFLVERTKEGRRSTDFFAVPISVEDGEPKMCPRGQLLEPSG